MCKNECIQKWVGWRRRTSTGRISVDRRMMKKKSSVELVEWAEEPKAVMKTIPTANRTFSPFLFCFFFVLFSVNFTFNKNMTKNLILLRSHWIDRNHEWLKILSLCVFFINYIKSNGNWKSNRKKNMKLGRDSSSDWMLFNSLGLCDLVCPFKTSVYFHHLLAWWWAHPSILRPLHMCATGRSTPRTVPKRYRTCTRIT